MNPQTREVLVFRRDSAQGLFVLHDYTETPALECASIGCTVALAELFEGLDVPEDDAATG